MRARREAIRFHIWSYAHFPLYLGIVVSGVGIERIVTAASRAELATPEATILVGAIAAVMIAMTVIDVTSAGHRRGESVHALRSVALALLMLVFGIGSGMGSPVALIVMIAAFCGTQLALSIARPSPGRTLAAAPATLVSDR